MAISVPPPAARTLRPAHRAPVDDPLGATSAAPYLAAVQAYARRAPARFHVPAHGGGDGADALLVRAFGAALELDVPSCIEGVDIGVPDTPLHRAERLAARTWGARRTWFMVNGSSEASHAVCLALGETGGSVVVQRNVHQSTIHGLVLGGLDPTFVAPAVDTRLGIAHCVTAEDLAVTLDDTPDAAAALVVSPTYFGATADVRALAEVCHARGVALVVDEAWGAHLRFHDDLPEDALSAGADVVISGTHKLVGSLTQSAMLHLGHRRWPHLDEAHLDRALGLVRSTSPSSLLMSSLDAARARMDEDGPRLVAAAVDEMESVKRDIRELCGLRVVGDDLVGRDGVAGYDRLRLAIDVSGTATDGQALAQRLLRDADVNLELVTPTVLIAHVGVGTPVRRHGSRLVDALLAQPRVAVTDAPSAAPCGLGCVGEPAMRPREAFFAPHERVPLHEAVGRVSADTIAVYPPGIANALPGERFTEPLVAHLEEMRMRGLPLRGTWDATTATVRVVRD